MSLLIESNLKILRELKAIEGKDEINPTEVYQEYLENTLKLIDYL